MTRSDSNRWMAYVVTLLGVVLVGGCGSRGSCGGTTGDTCLPGAFCKVEAGRCADPEAAGVCALIPLLCTLDFSPVCGCDGETYSNECSADAARVSIDHVGACAAACCDPSEQPGTGDNAICIEGATCCSDGQWQCNLGDGTTSCDAQGEACDVCGGIAGLPCGDGEYCRMNVGECCCDFQGLCMPTPDACIELFEPVCGCDGETYSNSCFADAAGISIDHEGECEDNSNGGGNGAG